MKRFRAWIVPAVLASLMAGCDSGGVKEGMPEDAAKANPQPAGLQDQMKAMGKEMTTTKAGKKANPPAAPAKEQ
jgi:hypothetical protein